MDQIYRSLGLGVGQGWLADVIEGRRAAEKIELARLAVHAQVPLTVLTGAAPPDRNLAVALRAGLVQPAAPVKPAVWRAQKLIEHLRLLTSWYPSDAAPRFERGQTALRAQVKDRHLRKAARLTAEAMRAILRIDDDAPVDDLTALIESLGVPVFVVDLPDHVHGMTVHDVAGSGDAIGSGWCGVVLVNSRDWWTRQRYTLAHELAHVIFRDEQPIIVDEVDGVNGRSEPEIRAEYFARYFLAPDVAIQRFWQANRHLSEEIALAKLMIHFGISRTAAQRAVSEVMEIDRGRLAQGLGATELVRDLMASAGMAPAWDDACAHQHEEGASPWMLSLALDAYRHGLVSGSVVADVLGRRDVHEVERELDAQGWMPDLVR
ncbi:ImmA/IrrE family metallo-endopeptidase [Saccharothrix saharensis]|uniref:ImmA/IrrE family metallo-endopeptidase n=1 Tax=Saccharothrix saharensis TaxID=571190 RepID=UPI0014797DDC|nr:ImmA/IrrE family metallo-endopeptidase [Saccharothrix saharensis]